MVMNHDELLQEFRLFLEGTPETDSPAATPPVDLFSLFSELTALKNEVRIESRQLKNALDEFRAGFTALDSANQRLAAQLQEAQAQQERLAALTLKPIILGLLDLHDRLAAGVQALASRPPAPPSLLASLFGRQPPAALLDTTLEAVREGQTMTLRKLEDLLLACGVRPFSALGMVFDPQTMRAVSTGWQPELDAGVVSEVIRTGFRLADTVLRLADVKVNKQAD